MTGQSSFVRIYDFQANSKIEQAVYYENRIFALSSLICEFTECSLLAELTETGDTLWTRLITDIDVAPGNLVIVNDTITITGNNDPFNTAWRMGHFTLTGEKAGPTIEIADPYRPFTNMFQLTTQYFEGKYVIAGTGQEDDTVRSLFFVVDKAGAIDTIITLDGSDYRSECWHSFIDQDGRLTTYHYIEFNDVINYRKIYKFNPAFDTVWSYRSENREYNDAIPKGCELADGRIILSVEQIPNIHAVRAIRPDGTRDWQHNYEVTPYRNRNIMRLKTAANGDILGCGSYTETNNIPRVSDSPWLFRMSSDGDLLWEHVYYDYDSTLSSEGSSRPGSLFDFIELPEGDIITVGSMYFNLMSDMLVLRVDSNGCMEETNCEDVVPLDLITLSEEPVNTPSFQLYPIPASDVLYISYEVNTELLFLCIRNWLGQQVMLEPLHGPSTSIDISLLPPGMYVVSTLLHGIYTHVGTFTRM